MTENSRDRTVQIIADHHSQIAPLRRTSYAVDGRGMIQMDFPEVPPEMTIYTVRMMKYVTQDELRQITPQGSGEADILHRMIETYDPATQAVVMACIDGQNPISIKLRLEKPSLMDQPGLVQ